MPSKTVIRFDTKKLKRVIREKQGPSLFQASALILKIAKRKIITKKEGVYAPPGQPPYTHKNRALKKSMVFAVNKREGSSVIGPKFSIMRGSARILEGGGTRKGKRYEPRPYMAPTLRCALPKIPSFLAHSS